ncbi:MAG: hypothetical protein RLY66_601 [Candidatus Parcubacteria bacterium]
MTGGLSTPAPRRHTSSLFMSIASLLFIASIVAAGGIYFWKSALESSQQSYKSQLVEREKLFNVDLIEELKRQNVKIDLAKNLVANHIAMSQIFDVIGRLTIEKVRFLSMDVSAGTAAEGIKIALKGYGVNFRVVAYQSDVLGQLEQYGLRKIIKNPILSDPSLDSSGMVSFGFSATVDPSNLSYAKSVIPEAAPAEVETDQSSNQ